MSAVGGVVAMVPEGLILLTSVAFTVGVVRLARRRTLVQELPAIEVLARVDVICLDKTGTITSGAMDVADVDVARGVDADRATTSSTRSPRWPGRIRTRTRRRRRCRRAYPDSAGLEHGRLGGVLVGPQVERGVVRRQRNVDLRRARDGARRATRYAPIAICGRRRPPTTASGCCCSPYRRRRARRRSPARWRSTPSALVHARGPDAPRRRTRRSAYFAEQGVTLKVISGDNPRTVGAVGRRVGLQGADNLIDARQLPTDAGELADAMDAGDGVRAGDPAPEAGDGEGAAVTRPRRRDDRRRRERRARAEGRRLRHRDGERLRGHVAQSPSSCCSTARSHRCPRCWPRAGG